MGEFEDKLNNILSSPKDMEKILGLARELSGSLGGEKEKEPDPPPKSDDGLFGSLGNIDPKLIGLISKLMGEYSSSSNDKTALVSSIKPYIREERREALDRAVKIAKLAHIAKIAFSEFSGGEFNINL
ncbi:MAG: hypothetical protein ACI3VB_07735 [Oscillospiraceae bacterium]